MFKSMRWICSLVVLIVGILSIGGAYAIWSYPTDRVDDYQVKKDITMDAFNFIEGDNDMVVGEAVVADRLVEEINKMNANASSTILDEITEERKDKGGWLATINELAADDPNNVGARLRALLGLDEFPELTLIIKFTNSGCGYELFTTRVDVDAKDENGEYIIPEEEFSEETTFIYPVNRTTFKRGADGKYVVDQASVGYSRAIYYYDYDNSSNPQGRKTRCYDVTMWAEGNSFDTAVEMENEIIGKEITVDNIDKTKEVYFRFSVNRSNRGVYNVATSTPGLTARIYDSNNNDVTGQTIGSTSLFGSTTYYLKLTYTTDGVPENFKFTLAKQ